MKNDFNAHVGNSFENAQRAIVGLAPTPFYAEKYRHGEAHYLPDVIAIVEEFEVGDVLDLGPGWGTMTLWLSRQGFKVTCMDMIPKGTWITDELLRLTGAKFVQADIFAPPTMKKFPIIVMSQVIVHLKHRADRAIRNVADMMTDDGVLVIAEPNFGTGKFSATYGTDWRAVPVDGEGCKDMNVAGFTAATLQELLEQFFEAVEVKPSHTGVDIIAKAWAPRRRIA